jgi:hypothetical protein
MSAEKTLEPAHAAPSKPIEITPAELGLSTSRTTLSTRSTASPGTACRRFTMSHAMISSRSPMNPMSGARNKNRGKREKKK